jgi:hypothetical protein
MKKANSVAITVAIICSLILAMTAGTAAAFSSAIQQVFSASVIPTIDGKWTANNEWDDGMTSYLTSASGVRYGAFVDKYVLDFSAELSVTDNYMIEFFTDKTNDAGDYVRVAYCTDTTTGGTAPQTTCFMIEYSGHGTLKTYVGNGTGWALSPIGSTVTIAQLVSISKMNGSNPHYTTEFTFEKTTTVPNAAQNNYICVQVYDASNAAAGIITWPPNANVNVPDTYGYNDASALAAIPEGVGFGVVAMLSCAAVMVGFCLLRKPKTTWVR